MPANFLASRWNLYYRIDGGASNVVVHEGAEFSEQHPMPGIYIGKNAIMLGDQTSTPITSPKDGAILVPVEISPIDAEGRPYNPTGGYTYTDAMVLHGRWDGAKLRWKAGERVIGDPARSTRGMVEPAIAFLDDGRLMMIMRGSNDKNPALPSYRWVSYSADGGWKWTKPEPWTYSSGEPFFSPSACSQLLKHSSGRLFWLGNINPANPRGNRPRYPFVIGEVDRRTGLLIRASVRNVDDRQPGEHEILTLSNFYAREDREAKSIALHMTRLFAHNDGWEGDAMLYRIPV
ncbi:MAG: exo-alpha-sialidase [Candidatus Solibacter usitatus]|nr:exo-alpha-sialidase [Candidatus Solibacter usitatus]